MKGDSRRWTRPTTFDTGVFVQSAIIIIVRFCSSPFQRVWLKDVDDLHHHAWTPPRGSMPKQSRATRRDDDKAHDIVLAIDLKGFLRTFCGLKSLGFRVCLREEVFYNVCDSIIRDYFSLSKSSRRRWVVVVVGGRENWNRCCATTPATAFDDDDDDD